MAFRLDDNVTITFLVISVIASMAFVVRYKNHTPCKEFEIKTLTNKIYTGTLIRFDADVKGYKDFEWDFGDNEASHSEVNSAVHSYDRPGEYVVTLKVDDRCMETTTIFVQQAAEVTDQSRMPHAIIPELTEVGKPTNFTDTTAGANAWEWRFGENEKVDAYIKNPVYSFRQPGWKTITLTVNGNNNAVLVKKIFVNPPRQGPAPTVTPRPGGGRKPINTKPETDPLEEQLNPEPEQPVAPPPVVKAPEISITDFKYMLYGVADKRVTAGSFARYFCDGNLNTYTNINGKPSTFNELCAKLAKLKKSGDIKSMTVTPKKNQETNCISSVSIVIRVKTGIFGLSKTPDF